MKNTTHFAAKALEKKRPANPPIRDSGNRCGHDKSSLRLGAYAKRGRPRRDGAKRSPVVIQKICAFVVNAMKDRNGLDSFHRLNTKRKRKRSERRESACNVLEYLITEWFQVATLRCAYRPKGSEFTVAPTYGQIANAISSKPEWAGRGRLSAYSVKRVIDDLVGAGYLIRRAQKRFINNLGEWEGCPVLMQFTPKFFTELGVSNFWDEVRQAQYRRHETMKKEHIKYGGSAAELEKLIKSLYQDVRVYSSDQLRRFTESPAARILRAI